MIGRSTIWRASIVCPCEREQSRDSSSFIILFQHKTELASAVVGNKGAPTPPVVNGSFSHRCNSSKAVFHHYISKEREYTTDTYIEWKQKNWSMGSTWCSSAVHRPCVVCVCLYWSWLCFFQYSPSLHSIPKWEGPSGQGFFFVAELLFIAHNLTQIVTSLLYTQRSDLDNI